MTLEFGEEHFKDLRLEHDKYDPAYDEFGHPSNEWSYKKVTIGTFKLPADFTYTTQICYREDSQATKEKALGLRGYDTYSTDHRASAANWSTASSLAGLNGFGNWNSPFADATQITINGWDARVLHSDNAPQTPNPVKSELKEDAGKAVLNGNMYAYDAFKITAATKDQAPSLSEIADLTDNGVTVEVYVCPVDADFITNVVVTRTQLMKVDRIGSDYVALARISPDSRDPRRHESGKGLPDITGYNAFAVDVPVADVKDSNYDPYNVLKDLKAGDRVAVVPYTPDDGKTWEVGEVYVPETVSGKLTDVGLYMNTSKPDGNATSITIGGTKYVINEWNLEMLAVKKAQINATRKDITGYLAKDGTILWATEIGNSDDWMIVGEYYQQANTSGKVVWYVRGWTLGNEEVNLDLGTIRKEAEKYAPGELVHYRLSDGGTGEYKLEKPNYTQMSKLYATGDNNNWGGEPGDQTTGEGVYNVAQWILNDAGVSTKVNIRPANSLIPLENYRNSKVTSLQGTSVGGAIFATEKDAKGNPDPANLHKWNYNHTTYKNDGVKFIYVSFSPTTGNVDYISVRKDAQNVDNDELAGQNTWWSNAATNLASDDSKTWVVSPAEAYVNDKGHVEAVVIKSEPNIADLSGVVIAGPKVGEDYGAGAEELPAGGNYAKRIYWQGPDFKTEKEGYFKNDHNVGDILVIRSTDDRGVMDCKKVNDGEFWGRNPDVIKAVGINALLNGAGNKSEIAFYVGGDTRTVSNQNGNAKNNLATSDLMTNVKVEGDTTLYTVTNNYGKQTYEGLVKVAGATWLDMRPANLREQKEVFDLGDLLELDPTTVKLNILLNAKNDNDNFRRAYAIVVTDGKMPGSGSASTAALYNKSMTLNNGVVTVSRLNCKAGDAAASAIELYNWLRDTLGYEVKTAIVPVAPAANTHDISLITVEKNGVTSYLQVQYRDDYTITIDGKLFKTVNYNEDLKDVVGTVDNAGSRWKVTPGKVHSTDFNSAAGFNTSWPVTAPVEITTGYIKIGPIEYVATKKLAANAAINSTIAGNYGDKSNVTAVFSDASIDAFEGWKSTSTTENAYVKINTKATINVTIPQNVASTGVVITITVNSALAGRATVAAASLSAGQCVVPVAVDLGNADINSNQIVVNVDAGTDIGEVQVPTKPGIGHEDEDPTNPDVADDVITDLKTWIEEQGNGCVLDFGKNPLKDALTNTNIPGNGGGSPTCLGLGYIGSATGTQAFIFVVRKGSDGSLLGYSTRQNLDGGGHYFYFDKSNSYSGLTASGSAVDTTSALTGETEVIMEVYKVSDIATFTTGIATNLDTALTGANKVANGTAAI